MRTKKEIEGKLWLTEELLKNPHGLTADALRIKRKERALLKWILGEGGDIEVDKEAIAVAKEKEKIRKLNL